MRRMSASVFASLLLMGFASDTTASAAFGYRDTGFDADDAKDATDIRSSTRKIWQDQKGHRWLSITVRAYETLGRDWDVLASIDGRGGPVRESRVSFVNIQGNIYCGWQNGHGGESVPMTQVDRRATCRMPLRLIRPNKRIRWRVRSPGPDTISDDVDRAPNSGWYR